MRTDINQTFDKDPEMKLFSNNVKELLESGMVILLPLYLIKLRKEIEAAKKSSNLQKKAATVVTLLDEGILKALFESEETGNTTINDVYALIGLIDVLYDHSHGEVNDFHDEGGMVSNMLMEEEVESIAHSLLVKGLSLEDVAGVTKLPVEKVQGLQMR